MIFRLIILNGPRRGDRVTVPLEPMTIGRGETCGLVIEDPEAAVEHAVVEHYNGGLLVRDLGSMNRVLVNKRETQRAILKHGDALEIGRTRMLVQAFVQAEISGGKGPSKRIGRRMPKSAAWGIAGLALVLLIWMRSGDSEPVPTGDVPDGPGDEPPGVGMPEAPSSPLEPPPFEPAAIPPAVVTIVTNTTVDPRTEQELQRLRDELAVIKSSFQTLVTQRSPEVVSTPRDSVPRPPEAEKPKPSAEPPPAAPPSRAVLSQRALTSARSLIEQGKLNDAESILEKLQREDPGFLAAYEARAEVFERRGMPDRAMGQWSLLLQRAAGTPTADKAAGEWARLSVEQRRASAVRSGVVRIQDMEQQRFPDSADYDEMRLIRVRIERVEGRTAPPDLRVEVVFFDVDQKTGAIGLTRAMQPRVPAQAAGGWSQGALTASAAYVAPAGYRAANPGRFHGYVVRVFSGTKLLDEAARPMDLLTGNSETARMASP